MRRHCSRFYAPRSSRALTALQDVNLVYEGDSISSYSGNYTGLITDVLSVTGRFNLTTSNFAVGGSRLADCAARASTVDAAYVADKVNILSILIGTNDLAAGYPGGVSAWITAYAAYLDARRLIFEYVMPITIISRSGLTDTDRHAANAGINGFVGSHCDIVADAGATSTIMGTDGACNDNTLFMDAVHPTALGYGHMRDSILPSLRLLIGY